MPEEMCNCFQTNLKGHIQLMIQMQRLVCLKYPKPLMGMPCHYTDNVIEAQAIRGQSVELYEQLIRAATLIMEETGVLLPMYDKALFSDAAYAAIVKTLQNTAIEPNFSQIQRLEVWRCTFHFSDIRWLNRMKKAVNLVMLVADFDCRFERVLWDMETRACKWNQTAIELTAWARLNVTALHQRKAGARSKQWDKGGRKR